MLGIAYSFFKIQNKLTKGGIRSAEADEIEGLDIPEMGILAYPEFVTVAPGSLSPPDERVRGTDAATVAEDQQPV